MSLFSGSGISPHCPQRNLCKRFTQPIGTFHNSESSPVPRPLSDADLLEGDALLRARVGQRALQALKRGMLGMIHLPLLHLLIFKHILFLEAFDK